MLLLVLVALPAAAQAAVRVQAAPVPPEMRSQAFTLRVNGRPVDVAHAAARYEYASFDANGPVTVEVTAAEPGFWDTGVDIQPWRLGLRPERMGQTLRFTLNAPAKLAISRPGDFLNQARMLFLFFGTPPPPAPPPGPHVRIVPAGVYHESLNPQSGETLYLAPGTYVFGSLNLWKVKDVKVLGRGTIVYDGPQDPNNDEGWMQKPDWHCIGAMDAQRVEIDGLTCIVRSRTWSIQMKDSTDFVYDDIRVIGGNPGNANQDGMDWLGGGSAVVRNAFLRTSDDVFAMQGNWDGYSEADMLRPGHDVNNILVERCVVSTSISNIVRAGWPQKTFNSRNFTLRDSDILHGGIGACGQTFGLLGFWGAKGAKGDVSGYTFENLFLDNWYSLMQIEQKQPLLHGFTFHNIWALDQPPLADSTVAGQVQDVTLDNVKYGQARATENADIPLTVSDGAAPVRFAPAHGPVAAFTVDPPVFRPRQKVTFRALKQPGVSYTWLFGDGTTAHGRKARHSFPDAEGTELDGSGRFRVLLQAQDRQGNQDWAAQGVVAVANWHNAVNVTGPAVQGLEWAVYLGTWTQLPDLTKERRVFSGESHAIYADAHGVPHYAATWDGLIQIPADGGYTFYVTARDGARLVIDGVEVARTGPPFPEVCGSPGNAVRFALGSLGLRAGAHTFHLEGLHSASQGVPRLLWQGPGMSLAGIPAAAYRHVELHAASAATKN